MNSAVRPSGIAHRLLVALMPWRRNAARRGSAQRMSEREFLQQLGLAFERQGYQIAERSPSRNVDFVLRKNRQTFLVLAREWQSDKVAPERVRALYDAMSTRNADGGIAVTLGRFSRRAATFAAGNNISLIEGDSLRRLLESAPKAKDA